MAIASTDIALSSSGNNIHVCVVLRRAIVVLLFWFWSTETACCSFRAYLVHVTRAHQCITICSCWHKHSRTRLWACARLPSVNDRAQTTTLAVGTTCVVSIVVRAQSGAKPLAVKWFNGTAWHLKNIYIRTYIWIHIKSTLRAGCLHVGRFGVYLFKYKTEFVDVYVNIWISAALFALLAVPHVHMTATEVTNRAETKQKPISLIQIAW